MLCSINFYEEPIAQIMIAQDDSSTPLEQVIVTGVMALKLSALRSFLPEAKAYVCHFNNKDAAVEVASYNSASQIPLRTFFTGGTALIIEKEIREAIYGGTAQGGLSTYSETRH